MNILFKLDPVFLISRFRHIDTVVSLFACVFGEKQVNRVFTGSIQSAENELSVKYLFRCNISKNVFIIIILIHKTAKNSLSVILESKALLHDMHI